MKTPAKVTLILVGLMLLSGTTAIAIGTPLYFAGADVPPWASFLCPFLVLCYGLMALCFMVAAVYGSLLEPGYWITNEPSSDG